MNTVLPNTGIPFNNNCTPFAQTGFPFLYTGGLHNPWLWNTLPNLPYTANFPTTSYGYGPNGWWFGGNGPTNTPTFWQHGFNHTTPFGHTPWNSHTWSQFPGYSNTWNNGFTGFGPYNNPFFWNNNTTQFGGFQGYPSFGYNTGFPQWLPLNTMPWTTPQNWNTNTPVWNNNWNSTWNGAWNNTPGFNTTTGLPTGAGFGTTGFVNGNGFANTNGSTYGYPNPFSNSVPTPTTCGGREAA